jgi:zinc finger FYVE domain-containing protein 26
VVAAKVKHARSGLNTGVAHCDQLLSQVDLLNMLVKSGCAALIPAEPLNGHGLRHLRDRLVEEELWMLAMEVSTKGGLDRNGVWAAWGKACLRAGCWDEAREKFSHCLEKVSLGPDSARPPRSPPLLNEIIQILKEGAYAVDRKVLQQADKIRASRALPVVLLSSPALTVLHSLSSLKEIAQGNYPQTTPPLNTVVIGPKLHPLFYEECRYYLTSYGSHAGIISFYLSHDDLAEALKHVLSQKVDPDVFLDTIYIPCLRQGLVSDLHQELSTVDPTLEVWKVIQF